MIMRFTPREIRRMDEWVTNHVDTVHGGIHNCEHGNFGVISVPGSIIDRRVVYCERCERQHGERPENGCDITDYESA